MTNNHIRLKLFCWGGGPSPPPTKRYELSVVLPIITPVCWKLSKNDLIVLFGYCSVLEYGNALNISQQDISDLTGIARPHVARSVKKLKEIGIFYSTDRAPRSMYIHPAFIAKGDLSQFKEKIEEWERLKNSDQVEKKDQEEEPKQTDLPF